MSSKLAVVINTCAGSLDPHILDKKASFGSKKAYRERERKLWEVIKRYAFLEDRLIIAGEWCAGSYTYVECPGPLKNPIDPLYQRYAGTRFASDADIIVYLNDDHFIHEDDLKKLEEFPKTMEEFALAFRRAAYNDGRFRPMEDGMHSYIMGHACALSWGVKHKVPWDKVPPTTNWDVEHTAQLRAAGVPIVYFPDVCAWDIEEGELPPL